MNDYTVYIREIVAVAFSKDMTKMNALSRKGQEWATKFTKISRKLAQEIQALWFLNKMS